MHTHIGKYLAIALAIAFPVRAMAEGGEAVSIGGMLAQLSCDVEHSRAGAIYKDCDINCHAPPNTLGLLDDRGKLYVLLDPRTKKTPLELEGRLQQDVTVTGKLVDEKDATSIIFVTASKPRVNGQK